MSQATGVSSKSKRGKFIDANIRAAGSYNAYLRQRACDRLDPVARAKLNAMLNEIDNNLDELQKEKNEYFKQMGSNVSTSQAKSNWQSHALSAVSKFSTDPNSFMFEGESKKRIDEIN